MSEIGIGFSLKANTAAFTQGLARANSGIKNLKKELREGDVGHGLKQLVGAGAIIAGMRAVVNNAQAMRQSFEEMGKPLSENIRSLAQFGDALDSYKKTAMEVGTSTVGFFTRTGESIGDWAVKVTNTFRAMKGKGKIETDEKGDRAVSKLEADRDRKLRDFEQRNSVDELAKKEKEIAEARKKYAEEGINADERRKRLLSEQNVLMVQRLQLENSPRRDQSKIDDNKKAQLEKALEIKKNTGDVEKFEGAKHDKFRMTVEQLSNSEVTEGMDPAKRKAIMDARKAMQLEGLAEQQGYAGKLDMSDASMAQANRLRQGLSGFVKSDDVNKDKDFADAVGKLNDTLNSKALVVTKVY